MKSLFLRRLVRRVCIGLGAGIMVAGLGFFLFAWESRHILAVPDSVREKLYAEQWDLAKGFGSMGHPGIHWQGAALREQYLLGFGLMVAGTILLVSSVPKDATDRTGRNVLQRKDEFGEASA